jgi:hypothetical protein
MLGIYLKHLQTPNVNNPMKEKQETEEVTVPRLELFKKGIGVSQRATNAFRPNRMYVLKYARVPTVLVSELSGVP